MCGEGPSSEEGLKKFGGESVGDMGRSVTQAVLWVSSTRRSLGTCGRWVLVLSDPITPPICCVYGWGRHHYAGADARGHFEA